MRTAKGRDAFEDVRAGVYKEWSVGFLSAADGSQYDASGVRHFTKVEMWPEVSIVLVGASPNTRPLATKCKPYDPVTQSVSRILHAAVAAGISPEFVYQRVMAELGGNFTSAEGTPMPRPADLPTEAELADPERRRLWLYVDRQGYVRRQPESSWAGIPRVEEDPNRLDASTRRWAQNWGKPVPGK